MKVANERVDTDTVLHHPGSSFRRQTSDLDLVFDTIAGPVFCTSRHFTFRFYHPDSVAAFGHECCKRRLRFHQYVACASYSLSTFLFFPHINVQPNDGGWTIMRCIKVYDFYRFWASLPVKTFRCMGALKLSKSVSRASSEAMKMGSYRSPPLKPCIRRPSVTSVLC